VAKLLRLSLVTPDIPSCLLLDDRINELLLSVGLCADRVLIANRHCANGGVVAIRQNTNLLGGANQSELIEIMITNRARAKAIPINITVSTSMGHCSINFVGLGYGKKYDQQNTRSS
jgi:hypothetical protein